MENDDETEEDEEFLFECSECGQKFDPDPDAMVDTGITPRWLTGDEAAKAIEDGGIPLDEIRELDEDELECMGLTPKMREQLLRGEPVMIGTECICLECQDRMFSRIEADEEEDKA